jgi:hypothetical protein
MSAATVDHAHLRETVDVARQGDELAVARDRGKDVGEEVAREAPDVPAVGVHDVQVQPARVVRILLGLRRQRAIAGEHDLVAE